ncbi:hypothetical protein AAF712_010364 [Marasmius tenuissimus]|uniref:Uncharacterized protein n=1 Tax=Marasmius tenuissimus TaxID=585030 RepID=A0ABR2ZQS4_9AGAR
MAVEGLTMTSISPSHNRVATPPYLFASVKVLREAPTVEPPDALQQASTRLKSVLHQVTGSTAAATTKTDVHAFDVLARIIDDPAIASPSFAQDRPYRAVLAACGNAIYRHANEWSVNPSSIQAKIEEAQWAAALLYISLLHRKYFFSEATLLSASLGGCRSAGLASTFQLFSHQEFHIQVP